MYSRSMAAKRGMLTGQDFLLFRASRTFPTEYCKIHGGDKVKGYATYSQSVHNMRTLSCPGRRGIATKNSLMSAVGLLLFSRSGFVSSMSWMSMIDTLLCSPVPAG